MTTDEIMKKIREGLTGEYSVDMVYLESQADKYRSAKNAKEIGSAIADLAYEILPDDKREVLNKMMYIDGKRLDVVFAEANKLIQEKKYGYMVAVKNNEITEVPLEEVAGKLKTVDPNCSMIQEAKMIGISFGDE